MSEPEIRLRRSTRNAAKRVADISYAAKAPAVKKKKKAGFNAESTSSNANSPGEASKSVVTPVIKHKDALSDESSRNTATSAPKSLQEGDELPLDFPTIMTYTGETVSIGDLVESSENGVVIFAYPKASTPGCTKQACLFRDNITAFSEAGYALYGISGDSPKSNANFHTKQNLGDIILLCDPTYAMHERLGIKKTPKGTIRSVTVIERQAGKAVIIKKSPANPGDSLRIAKEAVGIA